MVDCYYIGFSGTRNGMSDLQREFIARRLDEIKVSKSLLIRIGRHGNCVGADEQFDALCFEREIKTQCLPSNWEKTQSKITRAEKIGSPKPPMRRNTNLVRIVDILLAAPFGTEEENNSRGTWDAINKAQFRGIPIEIILPNGSLGLPNCH